MNKLFSVIIMATAIVLQIFSGIACALHISAPVHDSLAACVAFHQVFHVGWLHLIVNLSCLVTIVFGGFRIPGSAVLAGYIISSLVYLPAVLLAGAPTVGLSGIVYALLGMISIHAVKKIQYHGWIAGFLILGFFTASNVYLHLFAYLAGIFYAWMITPKYDRQ